MNLSTGVHNVCAVTINALAVNGARDLANQFVEHAISPGNYMQDAATHQHIPLDTTSEFIMESTNVGWVASELACLLRENNTYDEGTSLVVEMNYDEGDTPTLWVGADVKGVRVASALDYFATLRNNGYGVTLPDAATTLAWGIKRELRALLNQFS